MKTGIECYCYLLGWDLVIGGSWVKVPSEQEQEQERLNLTINYATCSVLIQTLRISTCKFQSHQVLKLYLVGYISVRLFSLHHNRVVQKCLNELALAFYNSFPLSQYLFPLSHSFHRWKVFRTIPFLFHTAFTGGKYFGALNVV